MKLFSKIEKESKLLEIIAVLLKHIPQKHMILDNELRNTITQLNELLGIEVEDDGRNVGREDHY